MFAAPICILTLCKYKLCVIVGTARRNGAISSGMELPLKTQCVSSMGRRLKRLMTGSITARPEVYAIDLVNGLEITVVYTDENDEKRRVISAWRSEPHERRAYRQNIES